MFYSILYPSKETFVESIRPPEPDYFVDLNLDQIFDPIFKLKQHLSLQDFFNYKPEDVAIPLYRQEILRELDDDEELRGILGEYSDTLLGIGIQMDSIRQSLTMELKPTDKWRAGYLTRGELLNCADSYSKAVKLLAEKLTGRTVKSGGLRAFQEYTLAFAKSDGYATLTERIAKLRDGLGSIKYNMRIKNSTIRVRKFEDEIDHGTDILKEFTKFKQGHEKQFEHSLAQSVIEPHIESAVLEMLSWIYKDVFTDLDDFCLKFLDFADETMVRAAREAQFYLTWLDHIAPLREAGLPFCYPKLVESKQNIKINEGFDLALALKMRRSGIVTNDMYMDYPERVIVITGPNQGGKTTFARSFGQTHYLAAIGLCVPGSEASLMFFDTIYTHFGRSEDFDMLNGQLRDDLIRLHRIITNANERSVIVVNEIFASTTIADALPLAQRMMDDIANMGSPAVIVTFLDELALHGKETVSMVFLVDEDEPGQRTFKVTRKKPDGIAFAMQIAGKHGLTYEQFSRRLQQ